MRCKANKQNKFTQILLAPIKILAKARDLYMRSMEDCAGRVGYGSVMGLPTAQVTRLPKSFSVNSSKESDDDEFRKLMYAASKRGLQSKVNYKLNIRRQPNMMVQDSSGIGRNYSVGVGEMGRIDEDEPCSFEENCVNLKANNHLRSRSYAVKRNVIYH